MIALVLKIMKFITLVIKINYCTGPFFVLIKEAEQQEESVLSVTLLSVI